MQSVEERIISGRQEVSWQRRWSPLHWWRMIRQDAHGLRKHRYVLGSLVATKLKVRYRRSALGFLSALMHPILMLSILTAVFSQIMRMDVGKYALYLFSGQVPWQFFSDAVINGSRSFISNEMLIKKVDVLKLVFPLGDILVAVVNMLFAMTALFIVFQFIGAKLYVQLVLLPFGMIMLFLFAFGIVLVQMTLVTYFRDFEHITQVFLQAFFFACPIIYPARMLGRYSFVLQWNPMTHLLEFFRCAFYHGTWPSLNVWLAASAGTLVSATVGYAVYKWREQDYVFRL